MYSKPAKTIIAKAKIPAILKAHSIIIFIKELGAVTASKMSISYVVGGIVGEVVFAKTDIG